MCIESGGVCVFVHKRAQRLEYVLTKEPVLFDIDADQHRIALAYMNIDAIKLHLRIIIFKLRKWLRADVTPQT
jgi:hypothetical protein